MKALLSIFLLPLSFLCAATPEFRPGQPWPDTNATHINAHGGGILLHEETYYWFGSFMETGKMGHTARVGVSVYSSDDLYHWTNRGTALPVSSDPKSDIVAGAIIERPKVIFNRKTGKFVMWFHLELKDQGYKAALSGVAVADQVTGPYHYLGSFRPNAGVWPSNLSDALKTPLTKAELDSLEKPKTPGKKSPETPPKNLFRLHHHGGQMARDMGLFVDDDQTAYHIYASEENSTLHISRLSDDYLKPAGDYIRVFSGANHEAPSMFKHRSKYFMFTSDCTGWKPNRARLSTADRVLGPWTNLGDPSVGTDEQTRTTFHSQPTFVLPVAGRPDAFIYMGDRWAPGNHIDSRYVWLPVQFNRDGKPFLQWMDRWDLTFFDKPGQGQ
jgi:beta-xylosidase